MTPPRHSAARTPDRHHSASKHPQNQPPLTHQNHLKITIFSGVPLKTHPQKCAPEKEEVPTSVRSECSKKQGAQHSLKTIQDKSKRCTQ